MIELSGVNKILKKKTVLENINISFEEGDFVLLKGHNGCGKTMLLRMIAGLISPDLGTVKRDKDYSYGVIIENPHFLMGENALYNLKYLAKINNIIGETEINEVLKKLNLYQVRKQKVRTFSLGMRQRLGLCQAFMENPDVLLLDEPFNAIDDDNNAIIYEMLNEYRKNGKIIVVASHGDVDGKCNINKVVKMNEGKISEIVKSQW
ncbi:MAG: ATP-binding cassette domain-containing protein [Butyrivibrio sp.]